MPVQNLADRLTLHELGNDEARALRRLGPQLDSIWSPAIDDLYRHLRRFESTSRMLVSDEMVAQLKEHQVRHHREMLLGKFDQQYAQRRWDVGATHHRIQLGPMWFLGAYAHLISYLADDLVELVRNGRQEEVTSLIKVLFLDIALCIEAYNLSEDRQLLETSAGIPQQPVPAVKGRSGPGPNRTTTPKRARQARLINEGELGVRLSFFECFDERTKSLSDLGDELEEMIGFATNRFYGHFTHHPLTSSILNSVGDIDRLSRSQAEQMRNLFEGRFDRPFAASRLLVGATHEKIGLPPHLYLAGVGHQLVSIILSLCSNGKLTARRIRGVASAFLLDASLVLDAYLESRRETLLRADSYATALLERLPTGVVVLDGERRIVSANQTLLGQFDLKGDMLRGLTVSEAFPSLYLDEYVRDTMSTASPAAPILCESSSSTNRRLYRVIAVRLPPGVDTTHRIALLFDDMTELWRAGEIAGQAETKWIDLISDVEAVVWEADAETMQLELVAGRADDLLGHSAEELLADESLWRKLVSEQDRESWEAAIAQAKSQQVVIRREHPSMAFEDHWLQSTVRVVPSKRKHAVLRGVTVDVTPQVAAKVSAERRLATEMALVHLGKTLLQNRSRTAILSAAFESLSSLMPDGIVLVYVRDTRGQLALEFRHPESVAKTDSIYDPEAVRQLVETRSTNPSPSNGTPSDQTPKPLKWELQGTGEKADVVIVASDPGLQPADSCAFAILTHFVELALQRAESERSLLQNQKMISLGTFAAGVAHDFNNTLSSVVLGIDLLRQTCDDDELNSAVDRILGRVDKSQQTIKQIVAFSRQLPIERTTVDLSAEIARICDQQQAIYPAANITTDLDTGLCIRFGAAQVEHIFINLLKNAIQATGNENPKVRVRLRSERLETARPVSTGILPAGEYVLASVEDSGPGIAEQIQTQIFDPFFTTKDVGIGTGLGLAIVDGYVAEAGGGVDVHTSDSGTQMIVFFPRSNQGTKSPSSSSPRTPTPIQPKRVLIIDDEPGLASLIAKSLDRRGHHTASHTKPLEALSMLQSEPTAFDVVIVDFQMPNLNGLELIERAREAGVQTKFILFSGMLDSRLQDSAEAIGAVAAAKPLSANAIETLIEAV